MVSHTPCPRRSRVENDQVRTPSVMPDMDEAILAQIDVMYPVAFRLTSSRRTACDLTERAILAALRNKDSLLEKQRSVKSAMLALLRTIYLASYQEQHS